jgi:pyruvate dehydrogenase E1 component
VIKAAEILSQEYQIASDVYSVTSFNELARDGQDIARYNMLHPEAEPRSAYVTDVMGEEPAIASTDYIKNHAEQIRPYLPGSSYKVLGTDGFGRSDSRPNLRRHFEVNAAYVVVAALHELSKRGDVEKNLVSKAIEKFGIDVEITNPLFA